MNCEGPGEGRDTGKCKEISDRALFSLFYFSLSSSFIISIFLVLPHFYLFFFVTTISPYIIPYIQTRFQITGAESQCVFTTYKLLNTSGMSPV